MSETIQFERVDNAVLSTQHDYQEVFQFCKATLISLGGEIKKEEMQSGLLEASWKHGTSLFGLKGSLNFRTLDDGAISITVNSWFKEAISSNTAPVKKVQEITQALLQEPDISTGSDSTITPPSFSDNPVSPGRNKTKVAAALTALFGGGLGLHKFYSGCWGWGLVYLGSCFLIPGVSAVIALVEFIRVLTLSKESFDAKYNQSIPKPFTFIW